MSVLEMLNRKRRNVHTTLRRAASDCGLMTLEALETRRLMSAWVEQGPGPNLNSEGEGIAGGNPTAGAVEAVATVPGNPNILYIGATSGGVWKTTDAMDATPTWTPLTDLQLPNLMISSLAVSPVNANVIFAGGGLSSAGSSFGNTNFGVARSVDGGSSWTLLNDTLQFTQKINRIIPTTLNGGQTILFSDGDSNPFAGGIYISTDNGNTALRVSGNGTSGLPAGKTSDLAADPGDPNRFYAAVPGSGVYTSTDGGVTWAAVNNGLTSVAPADRILLATHHSVINGVSHDVVYAALIDTATRPQLLGVFRSADHGASWVSMGTPAIDIFPIGQAGIHGALAADPNNPNVVYVSGDALLNAGDPAEQDAAGSVFRGDFSLLASGTSPWESIVGDGANNTAPHSDSRSIVFDANGNMLESNDGGIYHLLNPDDPATRVWTSAIGNLRVNETYAATYDPLSHVLINGSQDIGDSAQNSPGSLAWTAITDGDGGAVAVDADQSVHPGLSVRYLTSLNSVLPLEGTWDANNVQVGDLRALQFVITSGPGTGNILASFDAAHLASGSFVLNSLETSHMLIGTVNLYESFDGGNTVANLGRLNDQSIPITAMAYGSMFNGNPDPGAFYVASGSLLYHRAFDGGPITNLPDFPGGVINGLAIDPQNEKHVFAVDTNNQVWGSLDEGITWSNLTANLGTFSFAYKATRSSSDLAVVDSDGSPSHTFLLIGGRGGVFKMQAPGQPSSTWAVAGQGLPHAVVTSLQFVPSQQMLVASTFGRGVWTLTNEFGGGGGGPGSSTATTTAAAKPLPATTEQTSNVLASTTLQPNVFSIETIPLSASLAGMSSKPTTPGSVWDSLDPSMHVHSELESLLA